MATEATQVQNSENASLLAQLNGSFIAAFVVLCFDILMEGCYELSAMVCPVWFVISCFKALIQRPPSPVATARILAPIATLLIAIGNYAIQTRIAWANSATLIQACENYHIDNGKYPDQLDQLVPHYLISVPRAKYCMLGFFSYFPNVQLLTWQDFPPFGRRIYDFKTKTWGYVD